MASSSPEKSSRPLRLCVSFFALFAALATSAFAQIRGIYSPGSNLTGGGSLPDSGFSYENQIWLGTANQLKGPSGNPLPTPAYPTFVFDNNTLTYVPKFKFLKANLDFSIDIAFANDRLSLRNPAIHGSSAIGLTNTTFVPFGLGWQFKHLDLQSNYCVSAPTGRYTPGANNNLSSGFWTNFWQTGATIYFNKRKSTQLSLFNAYAWNTTQQGTNIKPGQNDSLDYSLSQTFLFPKDHKWAFLAGFAGYGQWQTTNNSGQTFTRDSLKYRVNAAGMTFEIDSPFKGLYIATGILWEYAARNTVQGHTMTISIGLQL